MPNLAARLSFGRSPNETGGLPVPPLPEKVNYAVKSRFLLGFLESVPAVAAKLKEPETKKRKFEEVVKDAAQAAVLVQGY